MNTLYHILGLPQGASHEQVKSAFRTLARRFHPDVNTGNAASEQRFKEVSQAYETLADPSARAAYDQALVCRTVEARRLFWTFGATVAATFALTTCAIGLALWWIRTMPGPEPMRASVPDAAVQGSVVSAPEEKQAGGETKRATAGLPTAGTLPQSRGRGSGWATYRNSRFNLALTYPADVFAYDVGPPTENARTFVSRDGRAMLRIFTADNVAGAMLARYRRSRMEEGYAGAVFDQVKQRKFGFLLSGTQGEEAFYERVTSSCEGRAIHGWQMIFPVSQRTLYDLVADEIDRTYTQRTNPRAPCG